MAQHSLARRAVAQSDTQHHERSIVTAIVSLTTITQLNIINIHETKSTKQTITTSYSRCLFYPLRAQVSALSDELQEAKTGRRLSRRAPAGFIG